jgi:hypothetical protein
MASSAAHNTAQNKLRQQFAEEQAGDEAGFASPDTSLIRISLSEVAHSKLRRDAMKK